MATFVVLSALVALGAPPPPPSTPGISFNTSFGSYMVLQQAPTQACVYGMLGVGGTSASIKVSVSYNDEQSSVYSMAAAVDDAGGWKSCLKPGNVGGDVTITATCTGCTNTTDAVIEHATFGDVWYCGGQSNMALSLKHTFSRNASRDAILAGNYSNIRIHGIKGNMNPFQPWVTLKQALMPTPSCPAGDSDCTDFMSFSGACYYFGQSLTDDLEAMHGSAPPIGLVHTAFGGSSIEQWLSNKSIATCEMIGQSSANQEWHDQRVLPYIGMTVKGWVWYQGENDMFGVKGNSESNVGYSCAMKALIEEWRTLWSATPNTTSSQAPFGIVTLASTGGEGANGLAMGAMRQAQTAGYGVLPASGMPNTFLAQAYDLDDEWNSLSGGGPCMSYGYNETSPSFHCCGADANQTLCIPEWANKCQNMCKSVTGTAQYMGGLHPRSKKYVGERLSTAALNTVYGGTEAYTGPTLAGCQLDSSALTIEFNKDLLRGESVALQPYANPNFTPYFHGRANPAFHSGSQLYVQTVASSFCIEDLAVNASNKSGPVYCPTWAGGVGTSSTRPAPDGRFPTFGGSGMTTDNDPNDFNMGWINLPIKAGPSPNTIVADLTPLAGKVPTAVRYAWGTVDCCDLTDPDTYSVHGCIANCPIIGSKSKLPANPFVASIQNNKCKCISPQTCDS
eukprot:m.340304 g.340304  ORF g.340304 m.340304 type:complete len:677 (+) comp19230_c0_seq1:26-2056(+)